MNFENHWNVIKVEMDEYKFLDEPGLLYAEGLGPCIGLCLAYKDWAGIIHSSHPPHDEKEIGKLITEGKRMISREKISLVHPVLCGSDPACDEDEDPEEYEQDRLDARNKIIEILREAGFAQPKKHWSSPTETAAVFADLESHKIIVEVDCECYEYPIPQV